MLALGAYLHIGQECRLLARVNRYQWMRSVRCLPYAFVWIQVNARFSHMTPTDSHLDARAAILYAVLVVALWGSGWSVSADMRLDTTAARGVCLVLLLVGAAATAWRKRNPGMVLAVTGLTATAAVMLPSGLGAVFLQFEAVFSAVLFGSRGLARFTTGLCLALTAGFTLFALLIFLRPDGGDMLLGWVLQMAVILLVPLLWAWEVRHHRQARAEAETAAEAQRQLAAREHDLARARAALQVQEHRRRIAQDLHDGVAGHLSAVALQTAALRSEGMSAASVDTRNRVLDSIRSASVEALTEMRALIDVLRDESPAGPFVQPRQAIEDLESRLRASYPEASLSVGDGALDVLDLAPAPAAEAVLRVAQEAVTNVLKHAGSGHVSFVLQRLEDSLLLSVTSPMPELSDQAGQSAALHPGETSSGVGLRSMTLRSRDLGGTCHTGAEDSGKIWQVHCTWPLENLHHHNREGATSGDHSSSGG